MNITSRLPLAGAILALGALPALADGGLQFDGSNDYVTMGLASGLGSETFTIETWFRRIGNGATASSGTGGVIAIPLVTKGRGEADGNNLDMNYFLGIRGSDGVLVADFEEGQGGASPGLNHPVAGVTPVTSDVWHHAAVSYDGSTWQLYLDGALETELVVGQPPRGDSIQHAALGSALTSAGTPSGAFEGILDEVRIWNYARSGTQIADNLQVEIPSAPGLVGRWALDETGGTTAADSSGNGHDGTLSNGPVWGTGYSFTPLPTVTLLSPADQGVEPGPNVTFTCNAEDATGLVSATLYLGIEGDPPSFLPVETKTISGTSATVNFTATLVDGTSYVWNCQVTNSGAGERSAAADFSLQVDANYPDFPTLLAPLSGAIDVPVPPTLQVQVSDPNADPLTVSFYGRATQPADFTVAVIPDTQHYAAGLFGGTPQMFHDQTNWIVANQQPENIAFVTHLGDVVQNGDNVQAEWQVAIDALYSLEYPAPSIPEGIPYGLTVGNHDQTPFGDANGTSIFFNQYFGEAHFAGRDYYGGHFGSDNDNNYQLFSASGLDLIVIHLEYDPGADPAVLAWANALLQAHSDRLAILVTHHLVGPGNPASFSSQGQAIYDAVKGNPNLFLMLGGHITGEGRRQDTFNGYTIHSLLSDYQGRTNGGNGWMRFMEFSPANDEIRVKTYSPTLDQFETDGDSEFILSVPLDPGFKLLGQNENVPSGSTTSVPWSEAALASNYEWYVTVTDSTGRQTQGALWTFTTAASDPNPPVISGIAAINVTDQSAEIVWSTDEIADSLVDFGLDAFYGSQVSSGTRVASHSVALTNLAPGRIYHYRVRSTDGTGNATVGPDLTFTTATDDLTPPAPNPMTWASAPASAGPSSITMTAATASDPSGVEYYFQNLTDPGHDSGWQTSPIYTDTLLLPTTSYTYRVKTRDLSPANNESNYSNQASATTGAGSAVVLRGPYLQNGKPDGVSIMWRTDNFTNGRVWIGDSPSNLTQAFDEPTPPPPFISRGANWKYLDNGSNQGTAWKDPAFNDSSWSMGSAQLGYGDGDEATVVSYGPSSTNKYTTTYFRHTFTVTDAGGVAGLELGLQRDDGAVIYLNGTEVRRDNMPGGSVSSSTFASSAVGSSAETTFFVTTIDPGLLVEGSNVLAVEIHQANLTSSDISFDLDLYEPQPGGGGDGFDHLVRLGGLNPDTTYFYKIGTAQDEVLAGGDAEHYFKTLPVPGASQPVRIWALGDSGTADNNARAVRDAYLDLAAIEKPADLLLMLGDNAYTTGTDAEYQNAVFENMYEDILRNRVLWSTQGNHDAVSYFDIFDLPGAGEAGGVPSGTEDYYSFDVANVHLICLSSQDLSLCSDPNSQMYQWLNADLLATTQPWIIAFWHHPAYTKGSHDSDNAGDSGGRMEDMRTIALPILEAGGVDLVLSGHSHSYERSMFINGHYGLSGSFDAETHVVQTGDGDPAGDGPYNKNGEDGAVYITAGSSGKVNSVAQHDAMEIWLSELGSVIIDVDHDQLDVRFLRELTNPPQIDDGFRITKNLVPDNDPPTPNPMTWASVPSAVDSTSIAMTATTASDSSGVQYYFENVTNPAHDSGWINSASWTDIGLAPDTTYEYRVKARDQSTNHNETASSTLESATTDTPPDLTAPTPDPMEWATVPTTLGTTSITMTAATASDPSEVDYFFENTTDPAHNSGWRTNPVWIDGGLTPGMTYTYRVKARDRSPALNETGYSSSLSATTDTPPDLTAPSPSPMTWATVPAAASNTSITMTATAASDPSGVRYLFENLTLPGRNSGWRTDPTWTDTGLAVGTSYTYQVSARDLSPNLNTTAPSDPESATTSTPQPVVLLFDDFETGDFDAGPWIKENGDSKVHGDAAFTGNEGVLQKKTTWIETAVDTTGHYTLHLKYVRRTTNLDAEEFFYAEWWDGADWQRLEETQDLSWTQKDWTLPPSASNNPDFKIRFGQVADDKKEIAHLDDVELTGVPTPPLPAPGQASAPSPADTATEVSTSATLSWTAGSDAASHDLYFGTDPDPGTNTAVNLVGNTYDPGPLLAGTPYYWRVDAVNTTGTTTGPVWSFTAQTPPPGPATAPNPAHNATGLGTSTTLSWTAGSDADSHNVYFGTNPDPGTNTPVNRVATTFDPGLLTAGTTYFWRVDEVNTTATTGGAIWSFTTLPAPGPAAAPSPAHTVTDVSTSATLSWTAGSDTDSHDVYFGTNPDPGTNTPVNQAATTFDPGLLTAGTTYFWRIDEVNPNATTPGAIWSFTTQPAPGTATTPTPANAATGVSTAATLSWTAGSGADSHNVYFGDTPTPVFQGNQAGTTFDPGLLTAGTTYFWRIDEINTAGTTTGAAWSFTTQPAPGSSSAPTPADGASNVGLAATLAWTAGSNTDSHNVYFGTDPDPGTNPPVNQTATTFNPGSLTAGTTYFWRVDEINAVGATTGAVWSFTTQPPAPGQASFPIPAQAATGLGTSTTLSWTAGGDADSHNVYFGTNPDPGINTPVNRVATTFDPGLLTAGTTYFWRVDEVNTTATTGGAIWSFTTLPAPGPAAAPSPAHTATDVSTSATLSWTAGSDADSHDVYFGTNPDPGTNTPVNQAATTFDPGPLTAGTTYFWRIDEVNPNATTPGAIWSFTTQPAPGTATTPTPANAATGVSTAATLSWTAGSGADSHNVYFGDTPTPVFQGNQAGTTFDPGLLTAGTTYFWRIDEINTAGTTTGAAWSFSTQPAPGPASAPTPADGASNVDLAATLAWTAGSNTDSHNVYFGTDPDPGTNPPVNQTATTFNPGSLTAGTTYFWRVDEINAVGATTGAVWSFTTQPPAPGQASFPIPAQAATGLGTSTTLSWTAGSDADSHNVYFGTNPDPGTNTPVNRVATTFDPGLLTAGTTYFWRVDEVNTTATTGGAIWSFTTLPAPGPAAAPSPAHTATDVSTSATLSWTAGSDADSHDVYFGTNPDPGTNTPVNQAATTFDPGPLTAGTTYFWRIDEVNPNATTPGAIWSFTTQPAPGTATTPTPANAATGVSTAATLSWTAGSGADSHNVYFGDTPTPVFQGNQAGTTFDPGLLTAGTTYFWRIDEINTAGTTTGAAWSFSTQPAPGPASAPTPADGASNVDLAATLAWTAGSNTDSHNVYFGTDPDPGTNPPVNQTATTFNPGSLTAGTTYFWRVDEINAVGATTGAVWSFTTLPAPGQASAPNPANGANDVSTSATLSWTAGSNVSSHNVYFGTNPDPGTNTPVNQGGTTFDPGPLTAGTTYHWRIDGVNATGIATGLVWSFTPAAPSNPVTLFSDDFESGDFDAGAWEKDNGDSKVHGDAAFTGDEGALQKKTTWIETAVDTTGHHSIQLKYVRRTEQLDAGEFLYAEWWDGASWNILGSTQDTAWNTQEWNLPEEADDNSELKIRFRLNADNKKERAYIDDVEVTGIPN